MASTPKSPSGQRDNSRQGNVPPRSDSLERLIGGASAPRVPQQRQAPVTTPPTTLDPVSQSLTDRYLSQQARPGAVPQRSPHLQAALDQSAATAPGASPTPAGTPTSVDPGGAYSGGKPPVGSSGL